MKKLFLTLTIVFLAAGCGSKTESHDMQTTYNKKITVGGTQLWVEVATSSTEQAMGLSGREQLGENEGMLFDYQGKALTPAFWMPNMKFNLDMVWIRNMRIIGITKDVPAPTTAQETLPRYYPPQEVDMVLEVNAGWTAKHGVEIGDTLQF